MIEPLSFSVVVSALIACAPHWLHVLENTALSKGNDFLQEQAKQRLRDYFGEKKRQQQMALALKHAVERGLRNFHTDEERDQYRSVLQILSETNSEALRLEAMSLLTISDHPDFSTLTEKYNFSQRISAMAQHRSHQELDATPYLKCFFEALRDELYVNSLFREQISDVIRVRAAQANIKAERTTEDILQEAIKGQRTIKDILDVLGQIRGTLAENYTGEQIKRDVEVYAAHVERTLHYLKLGGIVPQEGNKNLDPELEGIFVPLRTSVQDRTLSLEENIDSLVALLERFPYMVLLGGPGSGKSTAVRHLAWSHAIANQANISLSGIRLLSGYPLPLRIELRRLTEVRRHHPYYNFLSYATEVLLAREGVEISPQMFRELLERRMMLLLFDGLDEVAERNERIELVKEIEGFALQYPGNRILVTSRPVGYEFAPFSDRWFARAQVLEFDNEQIHLFLEHWYTYMLRLSPIPSQDQQELETLFETLRENPHLHRLAENPLLLTVMTALHRHERLPDKRILIYDRCADLLLEKWAQLRGTDIRWQTMKMDKKVQYACVAYLGFFLHKRSQERKGDGSDSKEDIASDVPARLLLRKIEDFLALEDLIVEKAGCLAEAKHFLELIQEEAGLIVERGTDEDGEPLYSFVHRTFQEYFAAAYIYEQYLQEEDTSIISVFLEENLHDPHWQEVILLLLGKLKRKPVTLQLGQILEGKIQSRRSKYTVLLQQDLFFVCKCLVENIKVERNLVEQVVLQLGKLVEESAFESQRREAWDYLKGLVQTKEHVDVASRELIRLIHGGAKLTSLESLEALIIMYQYGSADLLEQYQAIEQLVQSPDHTFEQLLEAAQSLWKKNRWSEEGSDQVLRFLISIFLALGKRPHLSIEQTLQVIQAVYQGIHARGKPKLGDTEPLAPLSPISLPFLSPEQRLQADQMLLTLSQRSDLSYGKTLQIAQTLWQHSFPGSQEESIATHMLRILIQRSDLPVEQKLYAAYTLDENSVEGSEEEVFAFHELWSIAQDLLALIKLPGISLEQILHIEQVLRVYYRGGLAEELNESVIQALFALFERPSLSVEERLQVAKALNEHISSYKIQKNVDQALAALLERPDLPVEEGLHVAQILFDHYIPEQERKAALQALLTFTRRTDVSFPQTAQILDVLPSKTAQEEQQGIVEIFEQRFALAREQALQVALNVLGTGPRITDMMDRYTYLELFAMSAILDLIQNSVLSSEQTFQSVQALWKFYNPHFHERFPEKEVLFRLLREMAQDKTLPVGRRTFAMECIFTVAGNDDDLPEDMEAEAYSMLLEIPQDETLPLRERVLVAIGIIAATVNTWRDFSYDDTLTFTDEEGEQFLTDYLLVVQQQDKLPETSPDLAASTLAYYVKLARQEILPSEMRENIYGSLNASISEFDKIPAFPE